MLDRGLYSTVYLCKGNFKTFKKMEKSETKLKQSSFKKLGWVSIGLCGLCCTLPIIGTFAGISSLTAIAFYMEKIGIVTLALAGFLFFY